MRQMFPVHRMRAVRVLAPLTPDSVCSIRQLKPLSPPERMQNHQQVTRNCDGNADFNPGYPALSPFSSRPETVEISVGIYIVYVLSFCCGVTGIQQAPYARRVLQTAQDVSMPGGYRVDSQ
jgi:hypothetical protein